MEDMALYTCIARNCNGRATASASITLVYKQIEKYPKFLKRLESTSIFTGDDGKLEVRATGLPQIKVKWFKDFMPLKQDRHITVKFTTDASFFYWFDDYFQIRTDDNDTYVVNIYNALPEHSGYYTCKASNDAGSIDTSAKVHVENKGIYKMRSYIPIPCLIKPWEIERRYQIPIRADAGRQEKDRFFHRLKYGYVSAYDFRIQKC